MKYLVQPMAPTSANMPWLVTGKIYTIVSMNSGKVLSVRNGQIELEQQGWVEDQSQQWRIEPLAGADVGFYRLTCVESGKVVDISGASIANGANCIEWAWHGGHNQQFKLIELGDGNLRIEARHSGMAVDVAGASSDDGANVLQWPWHGGLNQQWRLATVHDASIADDTNRKALLYDGPNYSGRSQELGLGSFPVSALTIGDNTVSSVRVPEGIRVTLYDNPNFRSGTHNRTWGVNVNDQIYTRDGVNGTWQRIDGALKQISVAADGRVWGVNSADVIYTRVGVEGTWQHIVGRLKHVSVNASGRVWGVNAADSIYTRDGVNGSWQQIDGALKQIDVSDSGRVWGVNTHDHIYTRDGVNGRWERVDGALKQVAVNGSGRVWGVNANDDIFTRDGVNGSWQHISGKLKYVSVAADGQVWGVNSSDNIYTRDGVDGSWQHIAGALKQVETSSGSVGQSVQITQDSASIGAGLDDRASGVVVEQVASVFQHYNYQGTSSSLGVGRYSGADLGLPDNSLSSIKVPFGLVVTLFEEPHFQGRARTFTENMTAFIDDFNDTASSAIVKAAGVVIPQNALRFGSEISLATTHSTFLGADGDGTVDSDQSSIGPSEEFVLTRAGDSQLENLVSFGDTVALRSAGGRYVGSTSDGGSNASGTTPGQSQRFVIERSGATEHNSFVTLGDTISLRSIARNEYLTAHPNGLIRIDRPVVRSWERFAVTSQSTASGAVTPSLTEAPAPGACGAAACGTAVGTSFCGAQAAGVAACGIDVCGADACGAAACGSNTAVLAACGAAASGIAICGADVAVIAACAAAACGAAAGGATACAAAACGAAGCGAAAGGLTACAADVCGAAACGAAACGAAACAAAACGADACGAAASGASACVTAACGADACAAEARVIEACPADACLANVCAINACPADACLADACAIDIIPIIPGI